ncbi:hypothetical protein Bbelb_157280 [Branchiostoma belcheri]|nr:hypothetical protein Bbelb_157280 [Branchiostoma belcheri]
MSGVLVRKLSLWCRTPLGHETIIYDSHDLESAEDVIHEIYLLWPYGESHTISRLFHTSVLRAGLGRHSDMRPRTLNRPSNSSQTKEPFKTAAPRPQVTHGQNIFRYVRKLTLSATHVYRNGAWRDSVTPNSSLVTVMTTNKPLLKPSRGCPRAKRLVNGTTNWVNGRCRCRATYRQPAHTRLTRQRKPTHPGNYVITITGLLEQSQPGKQKGPPASV